MDSGFRRNDGPVGTGLYLFRGFLIMANGVSVVTNVKGVVNSLSVAKHGDCKAGTTVIGEFFRSPELSHVTERPLHPVVPAPAGTSVHNVLGSCRRRNDG